MLAGETEESVREREDIEARLVARGQLLVIEFAPTALWVLVRIPGCPALVPVLWIVTIDEVGWVLKAQRLLLQWVMDVCGVIVVPDILRPRVFIGFSVVEENHVGL